MLTAYLIIGLVYVVVANTSVLIDGGYDSIPCNWVGVLLGIPALYLISILGLALWPVIMAKDFIKLIGGSK